MNSGLLAGSCIVKDFQVFLHDISVFDSKAYDLSSLSDFNVGRRFKRYSFDFWNTIPKQYVHKPGNMEESTGFFQLTFNQNPKIYNESLSIISLDMLLANLGGYFHIIYIACLSMTFMHRNYNFNMSMIRKIYHTDSRGTDKEPVFENDVDLLKHRVKTKENFKISFWRFTFSYMLKLCCFCKRCKKCACMKKR